MILPNLHLIAAVALNGVIGRDGKLPWNEPEDLRHFRTVTRGHALIVGRKTADNLPELPGREIIVASRYPEKGERLSKILDTVREAPDRLFFLAGGAEIYNAAYMHCSKHIVTLIHTAPDGDTFLPPALFEELRLRGRAVKLLGAKNNVLLEM